MESLTNYKTFEDDKKSIDDKISMLERYILAEDKEGFFNTLVFNSDTYLYMKLNDMLNKGEDISTFLTGPLENYFDDVENSLKLEILFKDLSLKISKEQNPDARRKMLDRFNTEFLVIGFDYPKPQEVKKSDGIVSTTEVKHTSELSVSTLQSLNLEECRKSLESTPITSYPNMGQFRPNGSLSITDFSSLLEKFPNHFKTFLSVMPHFANIQNLPQLLVNHYKKVNLKTKNFQFEAWILTKMTLEQITQLVELLPEVLESFVVVSQLLTKRFESGYKKLSQTQDKITFATQILNYVRGLKLHATLNKLEYDSLKEIAFLEMSQGVFNAASFEALVNDPLNILHFFEQKEKLKNKSINKSYDWTGIHHFTYTNNSEEEYYKAYLGHQFESGRDYTEFTDHFTESWLKPIFFTYKLRKGEKLNNVTLTFSEIELNTLRDKRELNILPETSFKPDKDGEVKIHMHLKNISNLTVNIHQIEAENYYKSSKQAIQAKMDLSGAIPKWTRSYEYKLPPIQAAKRTFDFPELKEFKRGVFIIEFVGDGLSSRALIRKGNLNLMRDSTNEGHAFYILDEDKQVCVGESAQLAIGTDVYKADATGQILVAYRDTDITNQAIISFEGHAELCSLNIPKTDITLGCSLLFNEESLESSKLATFILQPKLFAFRRMISVSKLKDVKVMITSQNTRNVRHSKIVENLTCEEGQDLVVDYMVPSKTSQIVIELKAVVHDEVTDKKIPLSSKKTINLSRRDEQEALCDLYLKQEKDGYKVRLLGKNGERYPGYLVRVTLASNSVTKTAAAVLETDANGEVHLGPLPDIYSVNAALQTAPSAFKNINKTWVIDTLEKFKNFPDEFDIAEGEDLCLPAFGDHHDGKQYTLVRTDENFDTVYEYLPNKIIKEGQLLYVSSLKDGYYVFYYNQLRDLKKVTLRVHKARRWGAKQTHLIKDDVVIRAVNQSNYLTYTGLKVSDSDVELRVLSNEPETVKVHVLGFNYFPDNVSLLTGSLKEVVLKEKSEWTYFAENAHEFYSEKELSDELKYTMERKNRQTFMGNTLEKPSGLLKRDFSQKTKADSENLGQEKDYTKRLLSTAPSNRSVTLSRFETQSAGAANIKLELLNSFLQDRGTVISNGSVDAEGLVSLDASRLKPFSTALLIIEDKNNFICETISLGTKEPVTRDLRLENSREANKVYLHERTVQNLSANTVHKIKDANNTEYAYIDSLGFLTEILKLLSSKRELDEWSFIKDWAELSADEQLKKYDKFASHEFHLFTYFKDRDFFEMVIKTHIVNKNEKSFIDYFLLEDKTAMRKFLDPVNVHRLNIIEKSLLIYALKDTDKDKCTKLYELLKLFKDKTPESQLIYNSVFDTILKAEEPKTGDVKDNNHTVGTSFGSGSHVAQIGPNVSIPNPVLANVVFSPPDNNPMIKENRGSSQSFRTMGVTDEFVERQYFFKETIPLDVTQFWLDFIHHHLNAKAGEPFLSPNFMLNPRSNTEFLAILAVLDLGYQRADNLVQTDPDNQAGFVLKPTQPTILFCKEIKERKDERMELDMIIAQQFLDFYDRNERAKDGSIKLKKVNDFVIGKIYASRIALTNLSDVESEITLLSEIPQGSIPIKSQDYLRSNIIKLRPLTTEISEFLFYFPSPGEYTCYPAAITKDGCLVSSANITGSLKVYEKAPKTELKTMKDILSVGSTQDILHFMKTENIVDENVFKFSDIYWLLKDKVFYDAVCQILEDRFIFDQNVFSFSLYHADMPRLKFYLAKRFEGRRITVRELDIYFLQNELLEIDDFKFREYYPLINPRVHDIGEYKHNILNRGFMNTYITFLKYLLDKGTPQSKDYFYLAIYFLLQDRVDDVLSIFPKINKNDLLGREMLIQYDYLCAYLDLYTDYPKFTKAREICIGYLTYPIYTWRNKFIELANQIAEFDGQVEISKIVTEEGANTSKAKVGQKQPSMEANIQSTSVKVQTRHLSSFTLKFYEVNLEMMFSQDPFMEKDSNIFSFIAPSAVVSRDLVDEDQDITTEVSIPVELQAKNLLIQVIYSDGKTKSLTYFPCAFQTFVIENIGQIKIIGPDGKPLSKVYVKCFSLDNHGKKNFYKDGYTDMRGTFDYAALNLESKKSISKFAILVMSKDNGAQVKQLAPPSDLQKNEGEAMKLMGEYWQEMQKAQRYDDMDLMQEDEFAGTESKAYGKKEMAFKKNKYWK